jgi:hypothetical protein
MKSKRIERKLLKEKEKKDEKYMKNKKIKK